MLSKIPDMRRHCLSIVANSQIRAARSYIENDIRGVLSQIDLWVQSGARQGSDERRAAMRRVVAEVEDILRTVSTEQYDRL